MTERVKTQRKWKTTTTAVALLLCHFVLLACSSIDCSLNPRVCIVYKLGGDVTPLHDSLTISTSRTSLQDTVLINRAVNVDSFLLPVSYNSPADVLYFRRSNSTGWNITDTVIVEKEDIPHFESVDCNPLFFHVIKNVRYTRLGIDSIVINHKNVNYDASKPHLYVYFKNLYQ